MLFSGSAISFAGAKLHSPGCSGPNAKITVIFRGSFQWTATEVDEAAVVFGAHDEFGANIDRAKVVHEQLVNDFGSINIGAELVMGAENDSSLINLRRRPLERPAEDDGDLRVRAATAWRVELRASK